MRASTTIALLFVALFASAAHAESLCLDGLYQKGAALVQSLLGEPPADREVIAPPAHIDPHMAMAPPAQGTMRIIKPQLDPEQR